MGNSKMILMSNVLCNEITKQKKSLKKQLLIFNKFNVMYKDLIANVLLRNWIGIFISNTCAYEVFN